jgi:carbon storage regulator CsrA
VIYTDAGVKVTVVVLGITGNQVRFGIKAPKEVHIDRLEVWDRKQLEKAQS